MEGQAIAEEEEVSSVVWERAGGVAQSGGGAWLEVEEQEGAWWADWLGRNGRVGQHTSWDDA
jgi:hypothetical protein